MMAKNNLNPRGKRRDSRAVTCVLVEIALFLPREALVVQSSSRGGKVERGTADSCGRPSLLTESRVWIRKFGLASIHVT